MRIRDVKALTLAAVAALLTMAAAQAQSPSAPVSEARPAGDRASRPAPGMTVGTPAVAPVAGAESGSMTSRPGGEAGKAESLAQRAANPAR